MKSRVIQMVATPAEIRQVDGRWIVIDRLLLLYDDGTIQERHSDDVPGRYDPVDLPEPAKRKRRRGR